MHRVLIIRTANSPWEILSNATRDQLFAGQRTKKVFFMPLGYPWDGGQACEDGVQDLGGDQAALGQIIDAFGPSLVFLQTSPHTHSEYLFPIVKSLCPKAAIWVESYDNSSLFSDAFLTKYGYSAKEIPRLRKYARDSVEQADVVIHKNGGAIWDSFASDARGMLVRWHPMMDDPLLVEGMKAAEPRREPPPLQVFFCGSVPHRFTPGNGGTAPKGSTLLRAIEKLSRDPRILTHIFNPADRSPDDCRYGPLRQWLAGLGPGIRYSTFLPKVDLARRTAPLDAGIFLLPDDAQEQEELVKIGNPNRLSTVIALGLPLVVDASITDIAETVRAFDAGLCLGSRDIDAIADRLVSADIGQFRPGALKLRDHWRAENEEGLARLRAAL